MMGVFGFALLVIVLLELIIVMLPTITRSYQMPFMGEFIKAIPGNNLWENIVKIVRSCGWNKIGKEHASEVVRPLCIKGSHAFRRFISILQDIQIESVMERVMATNESSYSLIPMRFRRCDMLECRLRCISEVPRNAGFAAEEIRRKR